MRSLLALLCLLVFVPASALAQNASVAVLGVTSLEGDDAFAADLSAALRRAAGQVRGWSVSERDSTLSSLELASGCEAPALDCLATIALSTGVERLVFGQMRHGSGSPMPFLVHLGLYDARSRSIVNEIDFEIASSRTDIDQMRDPAREQILRLAAGAEPTPPPAAVVVEPTPPVATPTTPGRELNWPALALLGAGLVSAGIGFYFTGLVIGENEVWRRANVVGLTCSTQELADAQYRDSIATNCSESSVILQFVFLGIGAAAGGVGLALLIADGLELAPRESSGTARLRIAPTFGPTQTGATVSLSF